MPVYGAHSQVAVGGYGAQHVRITQQHAVEVITYILLGHGKAGALDQTAQLALYQGKGQ